MEDFKTWRLDDASVGNWVWCEYVSGFGARCVAMLQITGATKTFVVLSDGTKWARNGKKWGQSSSWLRDHAQLVIDLPAAKAEFALIDAEQILSRRRRELVDWMKENRNRLTGDQLDLIEAAKNLPPLATDRSAE